ncbi:MAG: TonB-dependent receptor [Rhodopseudomonas palustris]|nr:MAG: TonB-dependent receptor [Rhodopseudomonas palustris]
MTIHRSSTPWSRALLASSVLVPALALITAPAKADPAEALPTIVVSPTGTATPLSQVASSVTVITAADIERLQQRTAADALSLVPGLNVVRTGGPGASTSVFMRGTNSNHVKVLIDGIDASDPSKSNGGFDFANLLTSDIERIEVLRGPQSGLYGSDAIGGVISITTKRGKGPAKLTATAEGGSFGTFNQTARASGAQGNLDYSFNVAHYRGTSAPVTPLELLPPGQRRNNDHYDNLTYSTKLGVQANDELAFNFVGRYTDAHKGFTQDDFSDWMNPRPEPLQSTSATRDFLTRSEAVWSPLNGRIKSTLGVSYANQWSRSNNPNPNFQLTNTFPFVYGIGPASSYRGERTKFDWNGVFDAGYGQKVVLGAERQDDKIRTDSAGEYDLSGVYQQLMKSASTGNSAGFAELQSEFTKNFFVVSNIRYDDNDSYGGHTTWRVAPVFIVPTLDTKLKATYGTGFKAPTLMQLYVNGAYTIANPALKPETSKGWDIGFEQPLFNDRVSFGATYFNNRIEDLIQNAFVAGKWTYDNVGAAKAYGVESFVSVQATDTLRFRADYTYMQTRDEATNLRLRRRPDNKMSLAAIWNPVERATITATVLHTSSWLDYGRFGPPLRDAPAFTTVNLAANYDIDKNVSVFGRIDNLFDKKYEVPVGFLQPGLGVFGGVRVTN